MNRYIVSDTHFGHANVALYCDRPFRVRCQQTIPHIMNEVQRARWGDDCLFCSVERMDSHMIREWNQRVTPDDLVDHLGDFAFRNTANSAARGEGSTDTWKYYWDKLNGNKTLWAGNHDGNNGAKATAQWGVKDFGGITFGVVHRPEDAVRLGQITGLPKHWIVGHVHNAWTTRIDQGVAMVNVGVEQWNYRPVLLGDAVNLLKSLGQPIKLQYPTL